MTNVLQQTIIAGLGLMEDSLNFINVKTAIGNLDGK